MSGMACLYGASLVKDIIKSICRKKTPKEETKSCYMLWCWRNNKASASLGWLYSKSTHKTLRLEAWLQYKSTVKSWNRNLYFSSSCCERTRRCVLLCTAPHLLTRRQCLCFSTKQRVQIAWYTFTVQTIARFWWHTISEGEHWRKGNWQLTLEYECLLNLIS